MRKILQISNYLYPNIGGIEQTTRDIARAISTANNYEQKILCFNETSRDGDYVCHRNETVHDRVDGIDVIRCGSIVKLASQSISLTMGHEMKSLMNSFDPDIVFFHYPNPFEAAYLLHFLRKKSKLVLYWHLDIVKQRLLGKVFHGQTINLLERADQIIATSPLYIEGSPYLRRYREKCVVIPSCINEDRLIISDEVIKKASIIRRQNEGKTLCLAVGRHTEYKGFKYLIRAAHLLDDSFQIYITGEGEETKRLRVEAGNDKKIHFLGIVDDDSLKSYFTAMDIFCFPSISKNEAFGLALAEGMYFGKPAVTFNIEGSGVNYVCINGEDGIEVENRNIIEYAEAIKTLGSNKELRAQMGNAGKMRVEKMFKYEQFKANIKGVINNL